MSDNQIVVKNLTKLYPKVKAVDNVSFTVKPGEIFGLLGPNGAGKTTTIRLLMTLIKPTEGQINILGIDARSHPEKIRQFSGYVPQDVSIDSDLTGYENVLMYSKLYGIPGRGRKEAINEILDYLDMKERAKDMAGTYSGGMMRRLEIAQALVNRPKLLFLDEPSIGLDPGAKRVIWELIKNLREEFGTIVFINTHDMIEADTLCDRIGIMEKGKLVIIGPPSELKAKVGGDVLTITSKKPGLMDAVKKLGYNTITESANGQIDLLVDNGEKLIPQLVESLQAKGIEVESVSLKKPTLDDVFLKYTGARIESEDSTFKQVRQTRRTFRRMNK
ncbi:MAG: ATP-binding cassette domain-containing protein [Dehalococcoidales bacterium]